MDGKDLDVLRSRGVRRRGILVARHKGLYCFSRFVVSGFLGYFTVGIF